MVAKRIDDIPDLRPRSQRRPWRYLGYLVLGGAATALSMLLIIAYGSDEIPPGWMYLLLLGSALLALYGFAGLVTALVKKMIGD